MKYIVVGFGRVGAPTVEKLEKSGHTVTVVETDETRLRAAADREVTTVADDGIDEAVLEEAGVASADGLAAVTNDLETNVEACTVAREAGCRTVLRMTKEVSDSEYDRYAEMVDEIVFPERVGAAAAKTALLGGNFNVISSLTDELTIASVTVPEDAPVVGQRVVKIELPPDSRIYAHGRRGEDMKIPLPQIRVEPGDSVAVMADPSRLPAVREAIRGR